MPRLAAHPIMALAMAGCPSEKITIVIRVAAILIRVALSNEYTSYARKCRAV